MSCSAGKGGLSHLFASIFKNPLSRHDKKASQPLESKPTASQQVLPTIEDSNHSVDTEEIGHVRVHTNATVSLSGSGGSNHEEALAPSTTVGINKIEAPSSIVEVTQTSSQVLRRHDQPDDIDIELGYPAAEIIEYWHKKEVDPTRMNRYDPSAPYVSHRKIMVEWFFEVTEELRLQPVTVYSAISLMDQFFCGPDFDENNWILQGICCISIAAKLEEAERNMPMVSDIGNAVEMRLPTSAVTECELIVSQFFDWDTSRVTSMHFLGYYLHQGIIFPTDLCQNKPVIMKVRKYMKKYVLFFSNLCQQEYSLLKHRPSILAASSIFAARRALCISPLWRVELEELCEYGYSDIQDCVESLWVYYETEFPSHKPLKTPPYVQEYSS